MDNLLNELEALKSNLDNLPIEKIENYDLSKTALFIIDVNNGFAKQGALYSPRVESLIKPIEMFTKKISNKLNRVIAFTDSHTSKSIELLSYPVHCLENDIESELVDELKSIENLQILPKNSTNGFFALENLDFDNIDNIIIVGDCTDICIYQFAITLKSYFNQHNIEKNIVVPMNLVDTYDIPNVHPAEILNLVFFNSMIQNGVNVLKEIR
ncbi:isochorismatase [Clostridioides difficile]|uniref:isochorismatase family cysteine hydrolase n=1 Tax=Clostridioides difficile TaxID=1496 RepID=UPI000D1F7C27|nr:isochorismatase family cysteine hydrolase [Clostridioides difficile]EGT2201955.1 isochorismatase family protein [Clostridioides difficile]EGT4666857.1 cysteine hydrolase [Clostridioides difficile]UUC43586.1 cysteine hydrolase [Clostridioides difficile]UWD39673.1 cysteine hydrolase [Clostridioides difficile]UWD43460.1 cysteine hydrolase [Clostridioides difficile]